MLQGEHSAILSTFNKLPFVIKIFVLSIFEWPFYTGFTVALIGRYVDGEIIFVDPPDKSSQSSLVILENSVMALIVIVTNRLLTHKAPARISRDYILKKYFYKRETYT